MTTSSTSGARVAIRRKFLRCSAAALGLGLSLPPAFAQSDWQAILDKARGQTVFFNAWAGDEKTNAFIAWAGEEMRKRHGVSVQHVRLRDTAEAVQRVVAEKQAGRNQGGSVDLIWINGANFLSMKEQGLLYGPFTQRLPNTRLVDRNRPSNLIDFTVPVDGMESPWRMAQIVFVYDSARVRQVPGSMAEMLDWARARPGRMTHPSVRNFLGATFFKQALYEMAPDPSVLARAASDAGFVASSAPLWAWYEQLRPHLWRQGRQFPENGPAQRQLLNDGELDLMISFNPSEAAVASLAGLMPDTVRTFVLRRGTIGNTSFVAIPYNAAHPEAAMVLANFLLEPATQALAQDVRQMGNFTVLDLSLLTAADRERFAQLPKHPALPSNSELGNALPEPHPSWMTRVTAEWEKRYSR